MEKYFLIEMKIFYVVVITVVLYACNESSKQEKNIGYIFSVKNFMRDLTSSQTKMNISFQKTVIAGGITETRNFLVLDWDNEYIPFIQSDLHKASWLNYISKDSVGQEVIYTTHKNSIPVKKIKLVYTGNQLQSLNIWKSTTSFFLTNNEELYADIYGNSKIIQQQKLLFFKPKILTIIIHPVKKENSNE